MSDAAVRSYEIAEPCAGSFAHPVLGEITWAFEPGIVQPKSEGEELVLEAQLVPTGLATVVDESIPARIVSVGNPDEAADEDPVAPDVDESVPLSVPTSGADDGPKSATVRALRAELAALGLDTSGTKAVLAARLAEHNQPIDPVDPIDDAIDPVEDDDSTAPEGDA